MQKRLIASRIHETRNRPKNKQWFDLDGFLSLMIIVRSNLGIDGGQ